MAQSAAGSGWTTPVGTVLPYAGTATAGLAALGWLVCDGSPISQAMYPDLAAVLGTAYGQSSGTVNLPDLRGYFLRGRDNGARRDPGVAARVPEGNGTATGDSVGS